MLSYILNGNGKYACTFIASSFFSLLMLGGLSSVRDVKSDQKQYASNQKIACWGKNSYTGDNLSNDIDGNRNLFFKVEQPSLPSVPKAPIECVVKKHIPTDGTLLKKRVVRKDISKNGAAK